MTFDPRLRLIGITDHVLAGGVANLELRCRELCGAGLPTLMIREMSLPRAARLDLAIRMRVVTRDSNTLMIVSHDGEVAELAAADGLHFSFAAVVSAHAIAWKDRILGVSCHSREEILRSQDAGATYAFLSPYKNPLSKITNLQPIGDEAFLRAVEGIAMPVIALGGLEPTDVARAMKAGAAGVATIGGLFGGVDPTANLRAYRESLGL